MKRFDLSASHNYAYTPRHDGTLGHVSLYYETKEALQERFGRAATLQVRVGLQKDYLPGYGKVYARTTIQKHNGLSTTKYRGTDGSELELCCSGLRNMFGLKRVPDFIFINSTTEVLR